jgi:ribosomal protein S19E (S16A)
MGYQSLKQKSEKVAQKQNPQATAFYQAYEKSILQKISEYLFIDEQIKVKAVREIYGSLSMPCKRFD